MICHQCVTWPRWYIVPSACIQPRQEARYDMFTLIQESAGDQSLHIWWAIFRFDQLRGGNRFNSWQISLLTYIQHQQQRQLTDWPCNVLTDGLTDGLTDWLVYWLIDWLIDWLINSLTHSLTHSTTNTIYATPRQIIHHIFQSPIIKPIIS